MFILDGGGGGGGGGGELNLMCFSLGLGGERGDLEASDWFSIVKYKK
jgi:hypothetical protein